VNPESQTGRATLATLPPHNVRLLGESLIAALGLEPGRVRSPPRGCTIDGGSWIPGYSREYPTLFTEKQIYTQSHTHIHPFVGHNSIPRFKLSPNKRSKPTNEILLSTRPTSTHKLQITANPRSNTWRPICLPRCPLDDVGRITALRRDFGFSRSFLFLFIQFCRSSSSFRSPKYRTLNRTPSVLIYKART
jgi:hypothetical protein